MSADRVLNEVVAPAMEAAADELASGEPDADARARLAESLRAAVEEALGRLGERARDPEVHRIVGAAASSAMALSLGTGAPLGLSASLIEGRLREGLALMAARPWSPEDQGRA
ncbi:hypothetical protein [Leifsonia sp. AG29]|uniref:hypothetical protein n=1 Tax=Leifsonia sp. AG29 TaxID=2598860 RepID=UPI001E39006B|nr:hypothetical protein [Leifsonia sp. AG29]